MTVLAIREELRALCARWDAFCTAYTEDDGAGGSPGEWMIERMDELETELKRRGAE